MSDNIATLCCNGSNVLVKKTLTNQEEYDFVKSVVASAFPDYTSPSYVHAEKAFEIAFMTIIAQDAELPMVETDGGMVLDSQGVSNIVRSMNIICEYECELNNGLIDRLRKCVDKQIEFECSKILAFAVNPNNDALETLADLAHRCVSLIDKGCDILEGVKDIVDGNKGKLKELLTPETIESLLNIAQILIKK